jgi:hypothetical protein
MNEAPPRGTAASSGDSVAAAARSRRARRILLLLAAIAIAPVAASYAIYYFFPRDANTNYGRLLPTASAPDLAGVQADGRPFALAELRGKWLLIVVVGERCDGDCEGMLYAARQARTMQGREQERVVRVLLTAGDFPAPTPADSSAPLIAARVDAAAAGRLPGGQPALFIVDPLGNLVLRYGSEPDIKGLARDLTRLLKASRIG